LRKQKELENDSSLTEQQKINIKINNDLEDMCIYRDIIKEEIIFEKNSHPNKFIETEDALQMKGIDNELFILGLLSNILENKGIETAFEKDINKNDALNEESSTCLKFISNGMINKKKYNLHFDFGDKKMLSF